MTYVKETSFVKDSNQLSLNYITTISEKVLSTHDSAKFARHITSEFNSDNVHFIFMNNSHQIISVIETNFNTFSDLDINTKAIVKHAINLFTPVVILVQKTEISKTPEMVQQISRLQTKLQLLDIKLIDAVLVTQNLVVSYADEGLI